jgi:hypothetical protein
MATAIHAALSLRARLLLGALLVLALVSVVRAIQLSGVELGSQDFQYSPSRMLLHGENPYLNWIQGRRSGFLLSQAANYLPLLYYALFPLAALPWTLAASVWAVSKVFMALYVAHVARRERDDNLAGLLVGLMLLSSLPLRVDISFGQQSMLVVVALLVMLRSRAMWLAALCLAMACTKYSLGLYILVMLLGLAQYRLVIAALALLAASFVALALHTGTSIDLDLLMSPAVVNAQVFHHVYAPYAWLRQAFGFSAVMCMSIAGLTLTFAVARASRAVWSRGMKDPVNGRVFVFAVMASLSFAPHGEYDYLMLVLPFLFFNPLQLMSRAASWLFLVLVLYYWNGVKLIRLFIEPTHPAASVLAWAGMMTVTLHLALTLVRERSGATSLASSKDSGLGEPRMPTN